MTDYPTQTTPITTISLREFCAINGHHFKRREDTEKWQEYTPEAPLSPACQPIYLSLINEKQGPSEPNHWSLFVARENEPSSSYQVTGDAEFMRYESPPRPIDVTASVSFANIYHLTTVAEDQGLVVKEIAEREPHPRAINRQSAKENCQGWTVRVIAKTCGQGDSAQGKA
ncbi:hypothetical protein BDW62DRAFT_212518 [Aspergillus aurantiobrunneus]